VNAPEGWPGIANFSVRPRLLRGLPAWHWLWILVGAFLGAFALASAMYVFSDLLPPGVATFVMVLAICAVWIAAVAWPMTLVQARRERRAGYVTLPADEDDRQLDEVDPSTGFVIRSAGEDPLTRAQRKRARLRAREWAIQVRAAGETYVLPFGWPRWRH